MIFSHIVACGSNRVIGKNNTIPWDLPEDRKYFRKITSNHIILMGGKTHKSLKKLLPDRINMVVSKSLRTEYLKKFPDPGQSLPKSEREILLQGGLDLTPQPIGGLVMVPREYTQIKEMRAHCIFENIKDAIDYCRKFEHYRSFPEINKSEIFIIGGGEIYAQTLHLVNKIYLTKIHQDIDGDAFYPEIPTDFQRISEVKRLEPFDYSFLVLERKVDPKI